MPIRMVLMGLACLLAVGCRSNPNKAEKIDTRLLKSQDLGGDEQVGVKNGNLVVQKKVQMNDELRRLQYEVYELEDRVYGSRKYGGKGLYGALKECRAETVSTKYGGDGKLVWTEPVDRVTDKEDEYSIGIDEHDKIVAVTEEFLRDRIARFQKYKQTLTKRQEEYEGKLEVCDANIKAKKEALAGKKE